MKEYEDFVERLKELPDEYRKPLEVCFDAVHQAANGKGAERHGSPVPFEEQISAQITRALGPIGLGFPLGQALKKIFEAPRLGDRGTAELHGAMNYLSLAVTRMVEMIEEGTVQTILPEDQARCGHAQFTSGAYMIAEERREQIEKHGFDAEHDDDSPFNCNGELATAAGFLLGSLTDPQVSVTAIFPKNWNVHCRKKFEEKDDIDKLVIAGALIAAEIDRRKRKEDNQHQVMNDMRP